MQSKTDRQRLTDLHAQRDEALERMREISDRAEAEGRDLSPSETRKYKELGEEFDSLTPRIKRLAEKLGLSDSRHGGLQIAPEYAGNGTGVRLLAPEQRMADLTGGPTTGALEEFGEQVRAAVTGDHTRAQGEGTDAGGGVLVSAPVANEVLDLARNAARVFQAGARTVPMESDTLSIPRLITGVTPAWKTENAAVTEDDLEFDKVTLNAQTLPIIVRCSQELFDDMSSAGAEAIATDIAEQIGLALDKAALYGTGVDPQPEGLKVNADVTKANIAAPDGAVPTDYQPLIDAVGAVLGDNRTPNAAIYSSRTAVTLGTFADSTGQPLRRPPLLDGLTDLVSNQVPNDLTTGANADTSDIFVGEWRHLLIGIRSTLRMRLLMERFADNLQVAFLAYLRADVGVAHPEAFYIATGVRA